MNPIVPLLEHWLHYLSIYLPSETNRFISVFILTVYYPFPETVFEAQPEINVLILKVPPCFLVRLHRSTAKRFSSARGMGLQSNVFSWAMPMKCSKLWGRNSTAPHNPKLLLCSDSGHFFIKGVTSILSSPDRKERMSFPLPLTCSFDARRGRWEWNYQKHDAHSLHTSVHSCP